MRLCSKIGITWIAIRSSVRTKSRSFVDFRESSYYSKVNNQFTRKVLSSFRFNCSSNWEIEAQRWVQASKGGSVALSNNVKLVTLDDEAIRRLCADCSLIVLKLWFLKCNMRKRFKCKYDL
ncbi:MAG: hypothetical protein ACTS6G_05755 [Candidatus Hodgkinia cicadicola]